MTNRKSLNMTAILILILTVATGSLLAMEPAGASASKSGVVNINTADATQLSLLPRIGPKAAERIIEFRKANGPFKKTTDLMQVKGIGDKTFELLRPYLAVEGSTTLSAKVRGPKRASSKSSENASPTAQ